MMGLSWLSTAAVKRAAMGLSGSCRMVLSTSDSRLMSCWKSKMTRACREEEQLFALAMKHACVRPDQ